MQLSDIWYLKNQLIDYATAIAPHECCGYLIKQQGKYIFVPTENIYNDPDDADAKNNNFAISEKDYIRAAYLSDNSDISAVVHSHLNGQCFSSFDIAACKESGVPWVLIKLPQNEIEVIQPTCDRLPLLGREFKYGVTDCYTLLRDVYAEIGITLRNYPRGEVYEWLNPKWNLFDESFDKEGFILINTDKTPVQKYDLLCMEVEATKINHVGIFWDVNRNEFIHQLLDRESRVSIYGGYWRNCTVKIMRHKALFAS